MSEWRWNPKVKGSGIITCIPQKGECPNNCADCFFQSGRSYLEPLVENLPHCPSPADAAGRVVRMNDGNDSNYMRDVVIACAAEYPHAFFNTATPRLDFPGPIVLTVNPGDMTDTDFYRVNAVPNLMFVRIRVNTWNMETVRRAVRYYTHIGVPVVLTFMAYFKTEPMDLLNYQFRMRTVNSYHAINHFAWKKIMSEFIENKLVHSCSREGVSTQCMYCGNCLREYHRVKELTRCS